MPRVKPSTEPVIPGDTTAQGTQTSDTTDPAASTGSTADPAADAFQASATGDTGATEGAAQGEGKTENEVLRELVASQAQAMDAMRREMAESREVMANLARSQSAPAARVVTEDALPDLADVDVDKFYAGNNTTPILTKQGWLTHPRQGWNPNAPKL